MYKKEQKRNQLLQFIKLGSLTENVLFGWGVESSSIDYSAEEESKRYIVESANRTTLSGYELQTDVEQEVFSDDPLFQEIDKIRRSLQTGQEADGTIINANLYLTEFTVADKPVSAIPADLFNVKIEITSFGEAAEDLLRIGYTIRYQGEPTLGNAIIDWDTFEATFTPEGDTGE